MAHKKVPETQGTTKREFVSRRTFSKALLGAGAATVLPSRARLSPARAQSMDVVTESMIIEAAARDMPAFYQNLANGVPLEDLPLHDFVSSVLALRAIERANGLDQIIESFYGVDGECTQMTDWA